MKTNTGSLACKRHSCDERGVMLYSTICIKGLLNTNVMYFVTIIIQLLLWKTSVTALRLLAAVALYTSLQNFLNWFQLIMLFRFMQTGNWDTIHSSWFRVVFCSKVRRWRPSMPHQDALRSEGSSETWAVTCGRHLTCCIHVSIGTSIRIFENTSSRTIAILNN